MSTKNLTFLSDIFHSDQYFTEPEACWPYGVDNSQHHALPTAVIFPENALQIEQTIQACNTYGIPFTARGRGTGTTGAATPIKGGIVCTFERMNRILSVDTANRVAVVEPGVTIQALNETLKPKGFHFAPDPTSSNISTIGGNLACNAAGPHSLKYGTCRENTLGLRAITGNGESITTGVYTTKGVVGYDLTRLLIGSEGTLGIITEATLKLTPRPESTYLFQAFYASLDAAAEAIVACMQSSVTPALLEFIDHRALQLIREYSAVSVPDKAEAMLMIEIDGPTSSLQAQSKVLEKTLTTDALITLQRANTEYDIAECWKARKALSPTQRHIAPCKINEDVVVPLSEIPRLVNACRTFETQFDVTIVCFGHAGNGNLHVNILYHPEQQENAEACLNALFDSVLACRGTLSGEHGIGLVKRHLIHKEITPSTLAYMKHIKRVFDKNNILNPFKTI